MGVPIVRAKKYHGVNDLGLSRYVVLYFAQASWLVLGWYLLKHAYWPSTCSPDTFIKMIGCSIRLPENRGWVEAALLTWLWSTPILLLLDVSRRYRAWLEKRSK